MKSDVGRHSNVTRAFGSGKMGEIGGELYWVYAWWRKIFEFEKEQTGCEQ